MSWNHSIGWSPLVIGLIAGFTLVGCAMPPTALDPAPAPVTPAAQTAPADSAPAALPSNIASTSQNLTPEQAQLLATLPARGAASELTDGVWFNSAPLQLADLRGKVVIVEFWTYG